MTRPTLRLVCKPEPAPRFEVWISARERRLPYGRTRPFRLTLRGLEELVVAAERIERRRL
jgi:hypothetical protein